MELPAAFQKAMEQLLGEEYPAYAACLEQPPRRGLRRNPLKCGEEALRPALFPGAHALFPSQLHL